MSASFPLSNRGIVRLPDTTYRVQWDGDYCVHVHADKDAAYSCLWQYDREQRQIDQRTSALFGMDA
jgi:hypothetical protein